MQEVEVKILEVDVRKIKKVLRENDAKLVKNVLQRNLIYHNEHTKMQGIVVRLRQEGKKTWFTVKSPAKIKKGHKIRWEHEIEIPSFKNAEKMIDLMGFEIYAITEAKREYWRLNGCSVEIINIPKIPTFIEIEGKKKKINEVAKLFGYSQKDFNPKFILSHYKIKNKFLTF